jgi:hypothetical protein
MDPKRILQRYLDKQRKALLAKLDGVSERDVRWPMTQTGTNLLGLVKHVASNELAYFGEVFDRPSNVPLPWFDEGAETNADMWATAEESRDDIVALYELAAAHADSTIDAQTAQEWASYRLRLEEAAVEASQRVENARTS